MHLRDYPLIRFTILFVIGILISPVIKISALAGLVSGSILIFNLILTFGISHFKFLPFIQQILITIIIILFGLTITPNQNNNSLLEDFRKEKDCKLYGKVSKIELSKDYEIEFVVVTDSIKFDTITAITNEKVLCKFRLDTLERNWLYNNLLPGNKIFMTGIFQQGREMRNPGEFSYKKYLQSKNISGLFLSYPGDSVKIIDTAYDLFKTTIFKIRKRIDLRIHELHNDQTAGLLRGLLLADRTEIEFEIKTYFINSGVIHILAVSGLHVGYVLLIFIFLFGRLSIIPRTLFTIVGLILFMFITGIPPSVFRATIMAVVILVAFLFDRSTNILNSISIAALIILLLSPAEIYNPGFQLSFSAVLSIAIIYPFIQKFINNLGIRKKWLEYILLFMGVSVSAQIGTIPFTLAYFSKLSVISIFTNLLVIPMIGIIIAAALITLFFSLIPVPLAIYFAAANDFIVNLLFSVVNMAGKLNFSFLFIRNYSIYDSIIFYSVVALTLFTIKRISKSYHKVLILVFALTSIITLSSFDDRELLEDGKLNVLMIDVGQGDSFLIKFPDSHVALIDAGEANPFFDNGERIILPLLDHLGINEIDYAFISHLDLDHYGGFISLLEKNKIRSIYRPKPDSTEKSLRLEKFLNEIAVNKYYYKQEILKIGNVELQIFNDPDDSIYNELSGNDKSGFIKLVYGKNSFLFTGDIELPAERYYLTNFDDYLDADVLKVGHHGSKTSSSEEFVDAVSPEYSLVSLGYKNKFNHPDESVIERLDSAGSEILRTDELGAVLMQSDGVEIKIINWKEFYD